MQPAEQRRPPVGRADLDGVVLLGAVERPEHPHAAGLADRQRHPRRGDLDHGRRRRPGRHVADLDDGQPVLGDSLPQPVGRDRHDQRRRQQVRRLAEPDRRPVQPGSAAAPRRERPLHREGEIGRGVGRRPHPAEVGVRGQRHAREVAVVGPRLQRLGAPAGDREVDRPERPEVGEPLGRRRLGGEREHRAVAVAQRDGDAHPQIGARARQRLERRKAEAHPFPPARP